MKRKILLLCAILSLVLLTTACQSKAVRETDALIEGIGTVTLDSKETILEAERAVAALNDSDIQALKNRSILEEARSAYNVLAAEDAISHIGDVTLDSHDAIEIAELAVDDLTESEYARVSNLAELVKARTEYNVLYINDVIASVDINSVASENGAKILTALELMKTLDENTLVEITDVEKLNQAYASYQALQVKCAIDDIGTVTLSSESDIRSARRAYDDVSSSVQAMVSNYHILESAERQFDELKAAKENGDSQTDDTSNEKKKPCSGGHVGCRTGFHPCNEMANGYCNRCCRD